MDKKAKIAVLERISDVGGVKMTGSVAKVRTVDNASIHGHHIAGTAFKYRHGWIPREGDHVFDGRQLDKLPEGAHLKHEFIGQKSKTYRKMADGTYTNIEDFSDTRDAATMREILTAGTVYRVTRLPTADDIAFAKYRHAVHADERKDLRSADYRPRRSSKLFGLSNDDDLAITPGGRVGDASPLAKPGYKGGRKLTDYERELAHALMRKGHPKSRAIAMARGIINHAASAGKWGKGKVRNPAVKAGALASRAQRASLANPPIIDDLDLAVDYCRDIDLAALFGRRGSGAALLSRQDKLALAKIAARGTTASPSRKVRGHPSKAAPRPKLSREAKVSLAKRIANRYVEHAAAQHGMSVADYKASGKQPGYATRKAEAKFAPYDRRANSPFGGNNPSNPTKAVKGKKRGSGRHVPGTAYRYRHGWIPVNLSEPMVILDLAAIAQEYDLDLAARWKHGYIPLNAEAVAIKEHHAKGHGRSSGGKNPLVPDKAKSIKTPVSKPTTNKSASKGFPMYGSHATGGPAANRPKASGTKFHSAKTKDSMSVDDLRTHARAHAAEAAKSNDVAVKTKHLREAQSSIDAAITKHAAMRSSASTGASKLSPEKRRKLGLNSDGHLLPEPGSRKDTVAPVKFEAPPPAHHTLPKAKGKAVTVHKREDGTAVVKNHRGTVISEHKSARSAAIVAGRHNRSLTWADKKARAAETSTRSVERKASVKEPPVFVGRKHKKGETEKEAAGVAQEARRLDEIRAEKAATSKPRNAKLAVMKPEEITKAIKEAHKMPDGAAKTRKLNALNAEKAHRIAAVKALARQHYEAQKLIDKSWPDGKQPLKLHNAFVKKLTKIFPALRSKLGKLRNEDGTVKGKDVLLTILDESWRQFARTIAGPLIGSGLAYVGFQFATKGAAG